jgi:hypothetical protein
MKVKNIIIILIILLFVYGCKGGNKEYTPTITSKDIYTGKEGLEMEFFENAPPKEIFENSFLPIGLKLYNKGAYDIGASGVNRGTKRGYLSISLEKDYMELNEDSLKSINEKVNFRGSEHIEFDLKGKNIEYPKGEEEVITFTANSKDLAKTDPQSEYHDSLISITACYKYQTKAVETVCIDTDVYGFKKRPEERPCDVKTLTLSSQGAPVAVTKIESEMVPKKDNPSVIKPSFLITVKNIGNGEVVKENKVEDACSSRPVNYTEWNNINVKAYISDMSEGNKLDCDMVNEDDEGTIILKQKQDIIRCSYEKGFDEKKGVFSSPLYIILDYGYTDTISREVRIKKVVTH